MAIVNMPVGKTTNKPTLEYPIYGASRLGVYNKQSNTSVYQFTDHLGNVRAVASKTPEGIVSLSSAIDYYPFGMPMPNRIYGANGYRYAYQGQEVDPETGKEAFQLRLWDGRIGRWLTTDPAGQFNSPYLGMGNNPISGVDPDGAWVKGAGFWNNIFHTDAKIYANQAASKHIDSSIDHVGFRKYAVNYSNQAKNGDLTFHSDYYNGKSSSPYQSLTTESISNLFNHLGGGELGNNLASATSMTSDWLTGSGARTRVFFNTSESLALKDSWRVEQARMGFFNKYSDADDYDGGTYLNVKGSFGLEGLVRAGSDAIEQFLGSYSINIHSNGKTLLFSVYNTTSFKSLAYGFGPDWERSTFGPGGNMRQVFMWTEKIK